MSAERSSRSIYALHRETHVRTAAWTVPVLALGGMIGVSATARSILAWRHSVPRYFQDEYVYAALGRAIAHGSLSVRGQTSHFPGLLEPLVAAPIWRFAPTVAAYHLVQVENAIAASLAAIPVYLLARRLGLRPPYAYLAAAYTLVVPSLAFIPFTVSDPLGYPLALAAITAAVYAIDSPSTRGQLVFLALAVLATLARLEYAVLVPAYILAAAILERRRLFRTHRVALLALVPVAVATVVGAVGFYSHPVSSARLGPAFFSWFAQQAFLLTLEAGVVIVPGAVIAVVRPTRRCHAAFAAFTVFFTLLVLAQASVLAADSDRFKERYVFVLLPLLALSFGVYLERSRPLRWVAIGIAACVMIAVARVPISSYATSTQSKTDSWFLFAAGWLEGRLGVPSASLAVALLATLGATAAVAIALRGDRYLGLSSALVAASALTIAAIHVDLVQTRAVRSQRPRDLTWIDRAATGPVTAIQTPVSLRDPFLSQLYWNTSIQRERLLDRAAPTDGFGAPKLQIGEDGALRDVTGEILLNGFGTTSRLADADLVARTASVFLWRPHGTPRFRLLIEGRFFDGWLTSEGSIRAWPARAGGGVAPAVSFTLSLPRGWSRTVRVRLGGTVFVVRPGERERVVCRGRTGRLRVPFSSSDGVFNQRDLRQFSARLTGIQLTDLPARRAAAACTAA